MVYGKIHSYQSLGTLDGPGVRFVVFLQGCPLRCAYCHNPDAQCPDSPAFTADAPEVFERVKRYEPYFGEKGGITASGGEPLMQPDFVYELFALCRENGISTCLDTSGCIVNEKTRRVLEVCDYALLDIKMTDPQTLKKYTGADLKTVMRFLELLEEHRVNTVVRQVIVPGFNDSARSVLELKKAVGDFSCVSRIELLAFRKLCAEKYERMGIEFPFAEYPECTPEELEKLQRLL